MCLLILPTLQVITRVINLEPNVVIVDPTQAKANLANDDKKQRLYELNWCFQDKWVAKFH
jgi:hypothetical protein